MMVNTFNIVFKGVCSRFSELRNEEICGNSETICEAVFRTNGDTCQNYCQSHGLLCENAWNDESGKCNSDKSHPIGCDATKNGQVCRCKTSK